MAESDECLKKYSHQRIVIEEMMIRHTVVFRLHSHGSEQEEAFLELANQLSSISTVKNFECLILLW